VILILVVACLLLGNAAAFAQSTGDTSAVPVTLGFTYDDAFLRDLPTSDNLYSVLETVQPSIIPDRFSEGGLSNGQAARVGGFLSSWTQTRFRIGDVDLTDPTGSGEPLLFPNLGPWQRIQVATGLLPTDINAAGLAITLEPRAASTTWQHVAEGTFSHGGLTGDAAASGPPSIARVGGWDRVALSSTGPLIADRLGAAVALSWTRSTQFDRAQPESAEARLGSAFASLAYTAADGSGLNTIGWFQHARTPFEYRLSYRTPDASTAADAGHLQTTWRSSTRRAWPWRAFASYSQRARTPEIAASALIERLVDGPVSALASPSRGTVRQWSTGARITGNRTIARRSHNLEGGLDLIGARARMSASPLVTALETVDGIAARQWQFTNPGASSVRHNLAFSAHANDVIQLSPRLQLSAGLRIEAVSGSADGAAQGISWQSVLPRARLHWRLHETGATTAFIGYTRSAYRLPLDLLAVGDPAAPTADVFRWNGVSPLLAGGPLVARVGPGTGGDPDFSRIDPGLKRPIADELAFGFELAPRPSTRFQLAAVGRRESQFIRLVNAGVPDSAYTTFSVADPGSNTGSPDDDKVITVFNRLPSTFGSDRFLLTNGGEKAALSGNLELSGQWTSTRLTFYGGATASIAQGPAGSRGYGPLENDQSIVTDYFLTPNGTSLNRGRLFNDRAFTIKLAGVYRLPWDVRVGAIARYQDGQPFSRMLVFENLGQGTEAVRAFAAGDSRFRFIATLDTRLQKGFIVAGRRFEAILDAFNLTGLNYDVEERAGAGPDDRTPIAFQPPRTFHVGVRVTF
jgi:hypothetical protein